MCNARLYDKCSFSAAIVDLRCCQISVAVFYSTNSYIHISLDKNRVGSRSPKKVILIDRREGFPDNVVYSRRVNMILELPSRGSGLHKESFFLSSSSSKTDESQLTVGS